MTPSEETNERNACDEWWHAEKRGASVQQAWLERARRAEADARDAARYRWLRDNGDLSVRDVFGSWCEQLNDGLDAAIDAAMTEESSGFEPCAFCAQPNTCTEAGGCDRCAK